MVSSIVCIELPDGVFEFFVSLSTDNIPFQVFFIDSRPSFILFLAMFRSALLP